MKIKFDNNNFWIFRSCMVIILTMMLWINLDIGMISGEDINDIEFNDDIVDNTKLIDKFYENNQNYFTQNKGQWDDDIKFITQTINGEFIFKSDRILITGSFVNNSHNCFEIFFNNSITNYINGQNILSHYNNYIFSWHDDNSIVNAPNYQSVKYINIWNGIDLEFFISNNFLQYKIYIHPFSDTEVIEFIPIGVEKIEITKNNVSYYSNNKLLMIDTNIFNLNNLNEDTYRYKLHNENSYGYELDILNPAESYIIGSQLTYSSFFGGIFNDEAVDMTEIDDFLIIVGNTDSTKFPNQSRSRNLYDVDIEKKTDIFLICFDINTSKILYKTIIGGTGDDKVTAVDTFYIESIGDVIAICGGTKSNDYPVTNDAVDSKGDQDENKNDGFLTLFKNIYFETLWYSTYISGSYDDVMNDVYGKWPNIFLIGNTSSNDVKLTDNAFDDILVKDEGIFIEFMIQNMMDFSITYSSYIGGNGNDVPTSIIGNSNNELIITGSTTSSDFLVVGSSPIQSVNKGKSDGFLCIISQMSKSIKSSTYIGGKDDDFINDCIIDKESNIVIIGDTWSDDIHTTLGCYDSSYNGQSDSIIMKFSPSIDKIIFSTYYGGLKIENANGVSLDDWNNIYVVGKTYSRDLPLTNGSFDNTYDENKLSDGFILKISNDGKYNLYSTFFGGSNDDIINSCIYRNEKSENYYTIWFCGMTRSQDLPLTDNSFLCGLSDAFYSCIIPIMTPKEPTNVTGIFNNYTVNISWEKPSISDNTNIIRYHIYRGLNPNSMSEVGTSHGAIPKYCDNEISLNTKYYYQIAAENCMGIGDYSEMINVTTDTDFFPPIMETIYAIDSKIVLEWSKPIVDKYEILKFFIYRGKSKDEMNEIASVSFDVLNYTDKNVDQGEVYFYGLKSAYKDGLSPMSNFLSIKSNSVPSPPTNITVKSFGKWSVNIIWDYPKDYSGPEVLEFNIYRGLSPNSIVLLDKTNINEYNDVNVITGTNYYYEISAINSLGESSRSEYIEAIPTGVPSSPTDFHLQTYGETDVLILWEFPDNDGIDISGFNIYKKIDNREFELLINLESKKSSFIDMEVEFGTNYYYYITSYNDLGESQPSKIESFIIYGSLDCPINLVTESHDGFIELQWEKPSNLGGRNFTQYNIYRGTQLGKENFLSICLDENFNDTQVENGKTYYYYVITVTEQGASQPSNIVEGRPCGIPDSPYLIRISNNNGEGILLSWKLPSDNGGSKITEITIYKNINSDKGEDFILLITLDSSISSFLDIGVESGVEYYYLLKSSNSIGISEKSEIVSLLFIRNPNPPTNISTIIVDNKVILTWDQIKNGQDNNIDQYIIYRRNIETNQDWIEIDRIDSNFTRFVDIILTKKYSCQYGIVAVNEIGESNMTFSKILHFSRDSKSSSKEYIYITFIVILFFLLVSLIFIIIKNTLNKNFDGYSVITSSNNDRIKPIEKEYYNKFLSNSVDKENNDFNE